MLIRHATRRYYADIDKRAFRYSPLLLTLRCAAATSPIFLHDVTPHTLLRFSPLMLYASHAAIIAAA